MRFRGRRSPRPAPNRRSQRAAVVLVVAVHAAGTAHVVVAAEAARTGAELILAAHAARAAAMVLTHAVMATRAHEARQQREAALLPVVEALIERRGRVSDALQGGAAGRHRVGPPLQAFDRAGGRWLIVLG